MGRNLPVCEDVVQVCLPCEATVGATLRSVFISGKSLGFNETLDAEEFELQELDKLVIESFTTLCTKSYRDKLFGSMPGRLDMVIESGGFRINK